jgi:hypothetical protein
MTYLARGDELHEVTLARARGLGKVPG